MIEEISIRGLGVIGDARLPLGPGFTALTGETGAGKTMVVTALGLLLGGRADSSAIRSGSSGAVVEGQWLVDANGPVAERVRDAGGDLDEIPDSSDAGLLLSRSLSAEGRSRAVVGGRAAPVGVLGEIGHQLVVVHGQSDQVRLRSGTAQRAALDRFAGADLGAVVATFQGVYRRWQSAEAELELLVAERDRRIREAEDLTLALAEIEEAAPLPNEDVELGERIDRLTNLEDLRLAASQAQELLSAQTLEDTGDVLVMLDAARRLIERASEHDTELAPISEALAAATFAVNDISAQLSSYLGGLDIEGARELETLQERRALLTALVRKHGPTLQDTIDFLDTGSSRLLELNNDSDRISALSAQVESDQEQILALADDVSALRRAAAVRLSEGVTAELGALAMANARLTVDVQDKDEVSLSGKDRVTFLLQPHPGVDPLPLGRGASGGELSRVMLAIEVVIAGKDPVPTFIFDEVDAGVGGASAIEIGRRLASLAQTSQVIVVTHLAQVAAFSTNHLRVVKDVDGSVTTSSVQQLEGEDRIAEMARLLSGLPDSESGLAHARELLEMAHRG
ncbi:DNA replication and repair protein RecN [Glaciihabitans tibetensis]|uniref:DNA repair protein RecN n=1 Tax=Glaciihabitans tibetensis TaxID=1266600 RepID=A0A2T0VEM3_9MICO|nr:DNA repair protein RecN [Glaciihabitans tibetensis]PRY68643.1 DNA replication and repair protein RecN [Glaciihabitans tibetensis]